jgi:hypothetical protein
LVAVDVQAGRDVGPGDRRRGDGQRAAVGIADRRPDCAPLRVGGREAQRPDAEIRDPQERDVELGIVADDDRVVQ